MKRYFSVLLLTLALAACGSESPRRPEPGERISVIGRTAPEETPVRTLLPFVVDSAADPILREAAELFAAKLDALTGGVITARVSLSLNPIADLASGQARILYISGGTGSIHPLFPFLAEPMRYQDYTHYTMAVNSEPVLELLNDRFAGRAVLLAGFYQGACQMISNAPPTGGHLLGPLREGEDEEPGVEDLDSLEEAFFAAVIPGSGMDLLLEEYGMIVTAEPDSSVRLALLEGEPAMAVEFTPAELEGAALGKGMYYLNTNHGIRPLWLALAEPIELPALYRAAMTEACSYLFPVIDEYYLEREARVLDGLLAQGVTADRRFDTLRDAAQILDEASARTNPDKRYLLNMIGNIS